jgi:hypothetical protein
VTGRTGHMGNTFRLWRGLHATVNDVEGAAASTMKAVSFPTMVETTAVPLEIVLVVVTRCFRRPRDACR